MGDVPRNQLERRYKYQILRTKMVVGKMSAILTGDSIHNVLTGLGSAHSKRAHNHYDYQYMNNWQQWEAAYQSDWLARAIVDIIAEDMTREWRTFKCEQADDLADFEKHQRIKHHVTDAIRWARLYGGSIILMLTDQPLDKPLDVTKIKRGSLKGLKVFDRFSLSTPILNVTDYLAENYMLPNYYTVFGGSQRIHWSHCIRFTGAPLPLRLNMQTLGWGDSELQKSIEQIMDFTASVGGISELMAEANIDVITRDGLADEIGTDQGDAITKRYAVFNQMKSVVQMALLDGTEKYDRKTLNLSGVAPIIELFMTICSGATGIPVTRLFGTSAKGLNATGEGDENNYNDSIRGKQMSQLEHPLWKLDEVFVRSALGYWPDDFNFIWNPLKQQNAKEIAETNKLNADADMIYLQSGIITPSQVQRKLQQAEIYQFNEEFIVETEEAENGLR